MEKQDRGRERGNIWLSFPWPGEREMDSKHSGRKEQRNKPLFGVFSASLLSAASSHTTHHNCTVFPPDPSIHPKGEERSQSAPDLSHPMPSNPSSLSTWTPPSFSSSSPPAAFLPGCPGISGPCAMPGPEGKFILRFKSKRLLGAACGVWLHKR